MYPLVARRLLLFCLLRRVAHFLYSLSFSLKSLPYLPARFSGLRRTNPRHKNSARPDLDRSRRAVNGTKWYWWWSTQDHLNGSRRVTRCSTFGPSHFKLLSSSLNIRSLLSIRPGADF